MTKPKFKCDNGYHLDFIWCFRMGIIKILVMLLLLSMLLIDPLLLLIILCVKESRKKTNYLMFMKTF